MCFMTYAYILEENMQNIKKTKKYGTVAAASLKVDLSNILCLNLNKNTNYLLISCYTRKRI